MAVSPEKLAALLQQRFAAAIRSCNMARGEVTVEVAREQLLTVCRALREEEDFAFEQLIDLCGVDYIAYGDVEWDTEQVSETGFSRGVEQGHAVASVWQGPRFAVVYHLLSLRHNQRLRLRVYAEDPAMPVVDSVTGIWASADWYEREAFDLFGILFEGHPDLRRILTDYGFIGHPFRKDFPLSGNVEMRYDPEKGRVVYQPVTIEPRVLVPRVIRRDHRYPASAPQESPDA